MFCRKCGFNLGEEKGFCPGCGTRVEQHTSEVMTIPYNGQQFDNQNPPQLTGGWQLELRNDKSNAAINALGIFAMLSVAVGTSLLVMSLLTALEAKKGIEIEGAYFEVEDIGKPKEYERKVIELNERDSSIK